MGKASRLRRERASAAAAAVDPGTVAMMITAAEAVGAIYGTHADCAAAAALLRLTAGYLGFELTPRAVSLYAHQASTDTYAFMGPKATAMIPEDKREGVENHFWEGKDTGHMILTSEEPRMLFDPNLRQLASYGMDAPGLTLNIRSTSPEDGGWTANLPDLDLIYMLDDNKALWPWYEESLIGHAQDAQVLAALIRAGQSPAQILDRVHRIA